MNFYRRWGRFYVQIDRDNLFGFRIVCGRWPEASPLGDDDSVNDAELSEMVVWLERTKPAIADDVNQRDEE